MGLLRWFNATDSELNQLDDVTVGGTSAGDIVTIDGSQTLSNKTIAASQVTEISGLTDAEGCSVREHWNYYNIFNSMGLFRSI